MWIRRDHATEPIRHERKKGKRNETNFRWPVFAERKRAIPPFATKARSFRFYCYFTRVSFPLIVSFITVEETRFVHRSRNEARNLLVIATTTRIYFDIGREGYSKIEDRVDIIHLFITKIRNVKRIKYVTEYLVRKKSLKNSSSDFRSVVK